MLGLMQDTPLTLSSLLDHAARFHGEVEIVSKDPGGATRTNYARIAARARQLAAALRRRGLREGDRVASLALNTARHLELYYGATGAGGILNTVNPRLFPEQIAFILRHAENRIVFFDPAFGPLLETLVDLAPQVEAYVCLSSASDMPSLRLPNLIAYEDLLAPEAKDAAWTAVSENAGAILCYTSGTTGDPKGVLYSHRSLILHAFVATGADGMAISRRDSILLVTPLFHVNAWGIPFSAAMCGAKLVLPGAAVDGESLFSLLRAERCTFSLGVPTVWLGFLDYVATHREELDLAGLALERILVGGSAAPRSMIERFDYMLGVYVIHAWGMTETSPLATIGTPLPEHAFLDRQTRYDIQALQGRAIYGVELRIVDADGVVAPHDGVAVGDLQVRGPWVVQRYFKAEAPATTADGWFPTGDVAKIHPNGYLQLTDRSKDIIKSGGEWISSVDLENVAIGHPDIREAAVIGVPHPKWQERPLLIVVPTPETTPDKADILKFLASRVARWQVPDDVVIVDSLPHTATGKLLKAKLRETYRDYLAEPAE
ncbi:MULTISPECIES: long-chain fatty acid--CoA ligase [unclassified Caulobacter]|jgi:fatty-acyl-CoA synthase|uniref:long-chain fatty acid--CoA ligase n=1 Tax=unclassified Caulobacter TaxID=2648921 RepID=UPI000781A7A4|nr:MULTISPECIES: long-chain fatty acid--CoA ligase [unclassified Caulobacter]AZS20027.1 long-chain-fatty-acid--CoA ligase [Caulobacter sp. FWC26]